MLIGLAVIRSKSQGEIKEQQRKIFSTIAPHVRAVRMQMSLEQQGALLMTNTLEASSLAAFVCDQFGRVKALAPTADAVVSAEGGLRLRQGQLNIAPRREYSFGFEARALVIVRTGQTDPGRMKALLRMAYGLTDTEAEVALSLASCAPSMPTAGQPPKRVGGPLEPAALTSPSTTQQADSCITIYSLHLYFMK